MPELPLEISAKNLAMRLKSGEKIVIIDVREPQEYDIAHLRDSKLIPMGTVPSRFQELDGIADGSELAILCHHGIRSLQVAVWLRRSGIDNCFSVAGGIDSWSREVDGSVPIY